MKGFLLSLLALLMSLFFITAIADGVELETAVPKSENLYVASVTINSTGKGLKVGEYQLLTDDLDLVGLYYVAKDANGTDKVLDYVVGEYNGRIALSSMEEITHASGNYEMFKLRNSTEWIPGTWTGSGLTNTIRAFRYAAISRHVIPYKSVGANYAEKIYLFSNDKTETLAKYEANFGKDSSTYKLVNGYYGTLDEAGIASALLEAQNYAKSRFESNIVYYAFEADEIIPVNELKTFKFASWKRQGGLRVTSNTYAKAIFYVANTDGTVTTHTWTSDAFIMDANAKTQTHTINVQSIQGLPKEGWIIGIELRPFAVVEDATKIGAAFSSETSTSQGNRFYETQLMPVLYPNDYKITPQAETPTLSYEYINGKHIVTVTNAKSGTTYKYKGETGDWATVDSATNTFEATTGGYWFVKAIGDEKSRDSVVTRIKIEIDDVPAAPTLKLGENNTLTAPDTEAYEIAKLKFNQAPVYETLTTKTLTAGVWAVRYAADEENVASAPQYFYIEGEKAGTAVYAGTSTIDSYVESRWAGTQGSSNLFDFWYVSGSSGKNPTAYGGTKVEIYQGLTKTNVVSGCSQHGYRYLFSDEEILPVSAFNDVTVTGINTSRIYYKDASGNDVGITSGKALTRVHVVGANVSYYDVYSDTDAKSSFNMPLSTLADKEGYAVAIEYFPLYELYDEEGKIVTAPFINQDFSYGVRFSPLRIVDHELVLNTTGKTHSGIVDGKHKFELVLADKAEKPVLAVENKDGKYIIKITNADTNLTYQYKSATSGWIILEKGVTSFEVTDTGTYTVKTLALAGSLSSESTTITFEGAKETPNLIPDKNGTITAPEGETYQYAKLGYDVTVEYTTFTTATLTPGLWAVKALGNGTTIVDSNPQIIYIMGEGTGTIAFAKTSGTTITKGLWTGTKGSANLFDWDNYTNSNTIFTNEHIEIYTSLQKTWLENNTFRDYGYRYMLKDSEIVPLSELIDLSATKRNGSAIKIGEEIVNYTRTRARVHVIGGDAPYYDVYTVSQFTSAPGFVFELSKLNDKKGYVTAIELYLFDELLSETGEVLTGPFTTSDSLYGITFANLILHEDIELANKNTNNTGLSADGENRYSLRIANDLLSPRFETLETNPNGIRITNYIEGERYAYATSMNGPWTEFEGDTIVFTSFGEYYIKLVANDAHEDRINLVPFKTSGIVIEGASLVLDGVIGIKVYFGADVDYTVSYKVVNEETDKTIVFSDDAEVESVNGKLTFTVPVYPKDASNSNVIITIKDNENKKEITVDTSIPEYIERLKALAESGNKECIEALDVIEAMEVYTLYAKNYFNKSEEALPNIIANIGAIENPSRIDNLVGAKFNSTSLILDEDTTIRHYFKISDREAFNTYTAYINEKVVQPAFVTYDEGITYYAYYDIKDIPAHKLGNKYTLEIYGADHGIAAKVTYSVTNYIKQQINSEDSRLANLMKALYNYFEESDKYAIIAQNKGQRAEIWEAMTLAKETTPAWKEVPAYAPTKAGYTHIKAITYDGFEYKGGKTKIFAYVGFPEGATAESPVPAIVLVHGGGGHPYAQWVKIWNDRGYAAIAMETTGYFPTAGTVTYNEADNSNFIYGLSGDFIEDGYVSAPSRSYPTTYTPVDEQWAYHGLSQVILASNILRADERVDDANIGITGVSWGGTMTSQVIGYDNRYSFAIPVYGTAYLSTEMHTFSNFDNEYVNSLWAAERNLDNADMPTFWFAYNDDNNFCVPAYYKSYMHTASLNDKNALLMLGNWSHSHGAVFGKKHSFWYADWVTFGKGGFVTFADQPKGKDVKCTLNIPEGVTGDITAKVFYITEPMSYSVHNKFGWGSYKFLDQQWQTNTTCLTVDRESSTVSGTVPEDAAGYYINIVYTLEGETCETSSIYIELE